MRVARGYVASFPAVLAVLWIGCGEGPLRPPAPGSIQVVASASGEDVTMSGLRVTIALGSTRVREADGPPVTINGLAPGTYTVSLEGLSLNCQVSGTNPRLVLVTSNRVATTEFAVVCTPRAGSVRVTTTTTGGALDPDGYMAVLVDGPSQAVPANGTTTITNVREGQHRITLTGVASNCSIANADTITVAVALASTADATFDVQCRPAGSVRVTSSTTGADLDPDGYFVALEGSSHPVAANGSTTISSVSEGSHAITLTGVAANCSVAEPDTVTVTVEPSATADAAFSVDCRAWGRMQVTVATTGVDLDRDGYTIVLYATSLNFTTSLPVAPNGSTTFSQLPAAADYRVSLQGIDPNCDVVGAPAQTVAVAFGATANVAFDLTCELARPLAITRNGDIYTVRSNGTAVTSLTTDQWEDASPAWSPTGRIAFSSSRDNGGAELYVMNGDGTNPTRLTVSAGADGEPSWSPDGQQIVFRSDRDANAEIYVISANGSGLTRLTNHAADDVNPAWSPTGKIAFVSYRDDPNGEIYVMNADGSNVVRLTRNDSAETGPAWSPDGSMIAFARTVECYYGCMTDIFVMNADGSNQRRLATGWALYQYHSDPSWAPNGRAIAFARQYCDYYYCYAPSVWNVDVDGSSLFQIVDNAAQPAWKP